MSDGTAVPGWGLGFEALQGQIVVQVQALRAATTALMDTIGKLRTQRVVPGQNRRWLPDVPVLSRAAADSMGLAPALFAHVPYDGAALRLQEETVRLVGDLMVFLADTSRQLAAFSDEEKLALCDMTYVVTDLIRGLQRLPVLSPEQKMLVDMVAPLINSILAARGVNYKAARDSKRCLKAQGASETAALAAQLKASEQENAVLRGGKVSSAPVATAAKRSSKRRSTPR